MIESSSGLTLLDPDHEVVVTGEEDHQDVLRAFAPADRPRRVAVELRFAPLRRGRQAGQRGIEVLLDGRRIGELTQLMSVRYGGHVDAVLRRGERPGAVGLVRNGRRGLVEVELRLPDAGSDVESDAPIPFPAPGPGRPSGGRGPRPVPHPPRAPRWRHRTPALVGGGVLALLLTVGAVAAAGAGQGERVPTVPVAAAPTTTRPTTTVPTTTPAPPTTTAPATTAPATTRPTTTTPAAPDRDDETVVAAAAPAATRPARPAPTPAPAAAPAPRPAPAPAPRPQPAPPAEVEEEEEEAASGCDPNYSGCVPIASDVDCEGGSGDGPAYVRGPVRVTGSDIYDLDRDGNGEGCE